jgi:hypothetical protein
MLTECRLQKLIFPHANEIFFFFGGDGDMSLLITPEIQHSFFCVHRSSDFPTQQAILCFGMNIFDSIIEQQLIDSLCDPHQEDERNIFNVNINTLTHSTHREHRANNTEKI